MDKKYKNVVLGWLDGVTPFTTLMSIDIYTSVNISKYEIRSSTFLMS